MALAKTVVGIYGKKEAGTAAFTTEAFTPPANSLLVVRVYLMRKEGESEMGQPSISGGGLTWTVRGSANTTLKPTWSTKSVWFTAPVGGSPSSMTVTVDDSANLNIYEYVVSVIAYTGYNTTTPIGGITGSGTTNIGDGEESRTLSEAPAAGDETLLCIDCDATKGPPKPSLETGWSLVHEKSMSGESGIAIASRTGSTSATVKVKDVYVGGGSFSKAGIGTLVVKAAEESNVTISAPAGAASVTSASPSPAVGVASVPAPVGAAAAAAVPALTVSVVATANATAPPPSPAVAAGAPPASAATAISSPTPGVSIESRPAAGTAGAPAPLPVGSLALRTGEATASAPALVPGVTLSTPAGEVTAGNLIPVAAVLIGAPPAPATASAPPPAVVVGEPPSPLDLDVPTKLVLEDRDSGVRLEGAPTVLAVAGTAAALRVEDTDAALAVGETGAALSLVPVETTVVLDDRAEELILDG